MYAFPASVVEPSQRRTTDAGLNVQFFHGPDTLLRHYDRKIGYNHVLHFTSDLIKFDLLMINFDHYNINNNLESRNFV